jgi:hypothetical protein
LVRKKGASDKRISQMLDCVEQPTTTKSFKVEDTVVYTNSWIKVPDDMEIKTAIVRSGHNACLAGHPGRRGL